MRHAHMPHWRRYGSELDRLFEVFPDTWATVRTVAAENSERFCEGELRVSEIVERVPVDAATFTPPNLMTQGRFEAASRRCSKFTQSPSQT